MCRVAGNVENPDILASLEYVCKVAKAKLIVVIGRGHCGAIQQSENFTGEKNTALRPM